MDGAINPTALHVTAAASLGGVFFWVLGFDAMGAALGSAGKALFNWHPVLMTAAFGVLVAESVLAFRSSRLDRPVRKSLHGVMHTVAVVLAAVGLWAVLRFHKEIGAPDFYSVHSYVGLLALSLLALQYAFGVACYWLHLPSPTLKAAFMPSHRALGKLVYLCGVAALVSGLMQKQSFLRSPTDAYSRVTVFANCLALLFLLTAGAVLFGLEPKAPPAAALLQHEVNAEGLGDALGGGGRKEPNGRKDSEA